MDIGIYISIRKQKNTNFTKEELIAKKTATAEMLDFILLCAEYGVSIGIAGGTGSGKTADLGFIGNAMPPEKRKYIVEDTRELNFHRYDENGRMISRAVHTYTRPSETESQNLTAYKLAISSLRCHPDMIFMSEMRGDEAIVVQEIARTGHPVYSSFHAKNCRDGYARILSMCERGNKGHSEKTLINFVYQSFPIMCHKKRLADGSIKYMEITEAVNTDGKWDVMPLWNFIVTQNIRDKRGRVVKVEGEFVRCGNISADLATDLLTNGAPLDEVRRFAGSGFDPMRQLQKGA